jgi:hypothetical protein
MQSTALMLALQAVSMHVLEWTSAVCTKAPGPQLRSQCAGSIGLLCSVPSTTPERLCQHGLSRPNHKGGGDDVMHCLAPSSPFKPCSLKSQSWR